MKSEHYVIIVLLLALAGFFLYHRNAMCVAGGPQS